MRLKITTLIAIFVLIFLGVIYIIHQLSFPGIVVVSWTLVLIFGVASVQFFRMGTLKKKKIQSHPTNKEEVYFSGFNLLLIIAIICGLIYLLINLYLLHTVSLINIPLILYSLGLLIGNNYKR